jgi:hypothetical protein
MTEQKTQLQNQLDMLRQILALEWKPKPDGKPVLGDDGPEALVCDPVPEPVSSQLCGFVLNEVETDWLGVMDFDRTGNDFDCVMVEFHGTRRDDGEHVALLFHFSLVEIV